MSDERVGKNPVKTPDERVEAALFKRALGYYSSEVHSEEVVDKKMESALEE